MLGLSQNSFELAFLPLLVLFVIGFWNILNGVSHFSGFLKLASALCLSMISLVAIQNMCIENTTSDIEHIATQSPSESALSLSDEPQKDFLGSIFPAIWLSFMVIGAVLYVITDASPSMKEINRFMLPKKEFAVPQNDTADFGNKKEKRE